MGAVCYSTVKSRIVRLTRLDVCGAVDYGPKASLVTAGFAKVENKWDIEEGQKFRLPNAWGDYVVNETDDPKILGADVAIDFVQVDPDTYDLISGARVLAAGAGDTFATLGDSIGYAIGTDTVPGNFAMETWTKVGGGICSTDGDPLWVYSVWGWLKGGRPGDLTLERGTATFPQSATAQGASASWAAGPYEDTVKALNAGEVFLQVLTDIQPPTAACGAVELVAPEEP